MTDQFWRKIDRAFGIVPVLAVFGALVIAANVEIKDLDLWLHLAMGKYITLHKYVPDVDVLSCSIPGVSWINHEWLFQVALYTIYHAWGPDGLIVLQVIVAAATMLVLFLLGYNRDRSLLTAVLLTLVCFVFQQRFTIRPDLFSLLFFTIYILVLSLHIDKRWAAPALVVVQILWSNMHGFFFFGPLFVLIGVVSEWIKRNVRLPCEWAESGRLTDVEYDRMKKILGLVVLACLLNPALLKGALYPVGVFFSLSGENKIFFKHIQELQKPVTWTTLFSQNSYMYYKLLIALSFISFVFNRRRIDVSALLFWAVFLIFSLKAVRNMPFFAFAAYLVIVTNLSTVDFGDIVPIRFTFKKFQYLTSIIFKLLFLIWMVDYCQAAIYRSYYDFDKYESKSEFGGVSKMSYPDQAVDFLVDNHIRGNFFNDFNSGAYLLGRTFPDIKVFIDGRTEVYGGEFFRKYQKILEDGDTDLFEEAVANYQITGALLNSTRSHIPKKILNYLYAHKDWRVVYFGHDAVIFLRDVPVNRSVIDRYPVDLARWEAPEPDLFRLGTVRVRPYRYYYRGYTLESLDLDGPALKELEQAIRIDPMYAEVYSLMGKIFAKAKDYPRAFEHFRIASTVLPRDKEIRHNLALSYLDLGAYEGAAQQYKAITRMWPGDPKGYFLMTKAYVMGGQYPQAMGALQRAHQLSPKDVKDVLELGDMLFDRKVYPDADAAYRMALEAGKEEAEIRKKLGLSALAQGNRQLAKEAFEAVLSLVPNDGEALKALQGLD